MGFDSRSMVGVGRSTVIVEVSMGGGSSGGGRRTSGRAADCFAGSAGVVGSEAASLASAAAAVDVEEIIATSTINAGWSVEALPVDPAASRGKAINPCSASDKASDEREGRVAGRGGRPPSGRLSLTILP